MAVGAQQIGFEAAGTNGIDRTESILLPVQVIALFQRPVALDDFIQLVDFSLVEGNRQTQFIEPAVGAGCGRIVGAGSG